MTLFDQYGIKEVADVTLYSIHKKEDGSGEVYYLPALYLDTLKISTTEKTAESTWAQGGINNSRLINWDFGKTINVNLEDALCTPASLGLCWNGVLSADWKDGKVEFESGAKSINRLSRIEKVKAPRQDRERNIIARLLPKIETDTIDDYFGMIKTSAIVDGTDIQGFGNVNRKTYKWKMVIESLVKSIAVVPDRFFDVTGKSYKIDQNRKVSVHSLPDYENFKDAVIYKINSSSHYSIPDIPKLIYDAGEDIPLEATTIELSAQSALPEHEINTVKDLINADENYKLYEDNLIAKIRIDSSTQEVTIETLYVPQSDLNESLTEEEKENRQKTLDVYKIVEGSDLDKEIRGIGLKTDIEQLENSLNKYFWNHKVDMINNDASYTRIMQSNENYDISKADYLAIIVDNYDNYIPIVGVVTNSDGIGYDTVDLYGENEPTPTEDTNQIIWFNPCPMVNVSQFKGIDMWLRFENLNEMIYFLITKYEDNIMSIKPTEILAKPDRAVNKGISQVDRFYDEKINKEQGRLWAYINPLTMTPYPDDYWFHQGESYYVKSLTIAEKEKSIKGKTITVKADEWPGMYMMIGETWIRARDTGDDMRLQIKIPLCKVKSDSTLTLEAGGEPTVFSLSLEVAEPRSGEIMEITAYEVRQRMVQDENGRFYAIDGSTEVVIE